VHRVGTLTETAEELGVYAGHGVAHSRRPIVDRASGSVHQTIAIVELGAGGHIEQHLHAFEEGFYVLSGQLIATLAGGSLETFAADDYCFVERAVDHALRNESDAPVSWLEVSAPQAGAALEDTVFGRPGLSASAIESPFRRGSFSLDQLPPPSGTIGLAGFGGSNVGGASLKMLIDPELGASQFCLFTLQYVPGGMIKEHDHAFEEAFFFLEGEIEAVLDGTTYTLRAGDYCWSGVGGMHSLTNRSEAPVRWLETQVPQPPSRHQARFRGDWETLIGD
jgi:mannose-6-phosphate isomerase-like protein (cupin superfamily)